MELALRGLEIRHVWHPWIEEQKKKNDHGGTDGKLCLARANVTAAGRRAKRQRAIYFKCAMPLFGERGWLRRPLTFDTCIAPPCGSEAAWASV